MALNNLQIAFDYGDLKRDIHKRKQFFIPGEDLRGVVLLDLNSGLRVQSLSVVIHGEATVGWEVPDKKKTFRENETYVDMMQPLLHCDDGKSITLPKGRHHFAFDFKLPNDIPSSFIGAYGSIVYRAIVTVKAEDDRCDTITSEPFMVLRRDPLPPEAYDEGYTKKSKLYVGLKTGRIITQCVVHECIAVPGEAISVSAEVLNWSGRNIRALIGSIVLECKYWAQGRELIHTQYLSTRDDIFDVDLRWGRRWTDVKIKVPPFLADSGLKTCTLMEIRYFFQFRVQLEDKDDIFLETPLYVGYHMDAEDRDPKQMLMNRMLNTEPYNATSGVPFGFTGPMASAWYGGKFKDDRSDDSMNL